ncbi:hypothetical protein [Turicibacter sanguinis]|uniref:hypothetical protein n=1 Tax=Turicibacter sanguinis TaxID=154288 RepID=UPI0018AA1A18|nr:hypothetical protein [Turicibacter sanguinis]MDB8553730.1 hypothetical protein [Turicibacter sanguinis]
MATFVKMKFAAIHFSFREDNKSSVMKESYNRGFVIEKKMKFKVTEEDMVLASTAYLAFMNFMAYDLKVILDMCVIKLNSADYRGLIHIEVTNCQYKCDSFS